MMTKEFMKQLAKETTKREDIDTDLKREIHDALAIALDFDYPNEVGYKLASAITSREIDNILIGAANKYL